MLKMDQGYAAEKWVFDETVTNVFDDMLSRSIPQYETMRSLVYRTGMRFALPDTDIVDIGCSRGEALASFKNLRDSRLLGIEISDPMLAESRARFLDYKNIEIVKHDLRRGLPKFRASLVLSVLSLMFIPTEYRSAIISKIYEQLEVGGALILVEKILGSINSINDLMVNVYYQMKTDNGYSQEAINRKRLSLEGVLVPLTSAGNEELLRGAGFSHHETIWQWMNFKAWVAIK
jgi:tRNA (cmo5U34)-methyltransferase